LFNAFAYILQAGRRPATNTESEMALRTDY